MSHASDPNAKPHAQSAAHIALPATHAEGHFPTNRIDTLAIIGVGLIGGSFAAAIRQAGAAQRIIGAGRRHEVLVEALELGLIDEIMSIEQAAARADFILLATPVGSYELIFKTIAPHVSDRAVITDGGSTKNNVVQAARVGLGARVGQFVPAHPIAGSHLMGPTAAKADLYRGRQVVVCPLPENTTHAVDRVSHAWRACGAHVRSLDPKQHDEVMATISHLPHWLAAVYMTHVLTDPNSDLDLAMAGTGFADFTRIAQGSDEMWRDIMMQNREVMLAQIKAYQVVLSEAHQALEAGDELILQAFLQRAAIARRDWEANRT
jgi:prephenate dehydrogenase